jgi:hypothetical protein
MAQGHSSVLLQAQLKLQSLHCSSRSSSQQRQCC